MSTEVIVIAVILGTLIVLLVIWIETDNAYVWLALLVFPLAGGVQLVVDRYNERRRSTVTPITPITPIKDRTDNQNLQKATGLCFDPIQFDDDQVINKALNNKKKFVIYHHTKVQAHCFSTDDILKKEYTLRTYIGREVVKVFIPHVVYIFKDSLVNSSNTLKRQKFSLGKGERTRLHINNGYHLNTVFNLVPVSW